MIASMAAPISEFSDNGRFDSACGASSSRTKTTPIPACATAVPAAEPAVPQWKP